MLFYSYPFLFFFIVVFAVYYFPIIQRKVRLQNLWLLLSSYFFYGYTDLRMVTVLIVATILFYGIGLWIKEAIRQGKTKEAFFIKTFGVCIGVGILFYFKYLGFFANSFNALLNRFGLDVSWNTIHIVMPIGVSFFTFKLISYVIEIYREHIEPCRNVVSFATYIAFFPTILSGPIDRPNAFLPQLDRKRCFDEPLSFDGVSQIIWGLFAKLCIADTLATFTDTVWLNNGKVSSSTLVLSLLLYPIQIYADFDGYSNMAIGFAKILGFRVARNFNHPFIARNVAEYWRRWHMSLTGWLTDYVFVPLNIRFRDMAHWGTCLAAIINLVLVGFWHGANWTYGLFGLYHGLLFVPLVFKGSFAKRKKLKTREGGLPVFKDVIGMIGTYILVAIGLVIFRAPGLGDAIGYFVNVFSSGLFSFPKFVGIKVAISMLLSMVVIALEWIQRDKEYSSQIMIGSHGIRVLIDLLLIMLIILLGTFGGNQFIYFQF